MPDRILLLRPGALGDAVVTMPVLDALRGRDIVVAGHPVFRFGDTGAGWLAFDDTRLLGLYSERGRCEAVEGFGTCVLIARHADPRMEANARRSGVGQFVFHACEPPPGVHISDHLLGVLAALGVEPAARSARLPSWRECVDAGRKALVARGVTGDYVVLHPGSGGQAKRWPVTRFAELASRLDEPVVWLLGPAERDDARARTVGESVGTVVDELSLAELAGVLAGCHGYAGNDSGVSHLAGALGAPTAAVFGATDPAVWAPRGQRVAIASGWGRGGLEAVTVDEVEAAIRRSRSW